MKPKQPKICIQITYREETKPSKRTMDKHNKTTEDIRRRADNNSRKFICSICLNTRPEDQCKSCHLCQRSCPNSHGQIREQRANPESDRRNITHAKTIQTSQTDVSKGLNLLNEVLNVFHTKKSLEIKNSKTVILKDAAISTDSIGILQQKLTTSKIFQHSIEGEICSNANRNMFVIVNSCQPCHDTNPNLTIDLSRPKSCSIPQMKLEELKYSLKEVKLNRSKDAVEEVNRMFANVKKIAPDDADGNRPATRLGPRVLPVVKTKHYEPQQKKSPNVEKDVNRDCSHCCVNYNLSGGDSSKNVVKSGDDRIQILCCRQKQCACESPREAEVCNCSRNNKTIHANGLSHFDGRSKFS